MDGKPQDDAFSAALNGILSNPQMMSMISSMADKLKSGSSDSPPVTQNESDGQTDEEALEAASPTPALPELSGAISALAPLLSGGLLKGSPQDEQRACLLRALKPYLSPRRSDAIEHIITVSKLSHLFKNQQDRS